MTDHVLEKKRFKLLKKVTGASDRSDKREREENIETIRTGVINLYDQINEHLKKKKMKDVKRKLHQLLSFDNSFDEKYMFLLYTKLNVTNSVDAYDGFRKLNNRKRNAMMNSRYFQILYQNKNYRPLLNDMILHTFYKKKRKQDRMDITIVRNQ